MKNFGMTTTSGVVTPWSASAALHDIVFSGSVRTVSWSPGLRRHQEPYRQQLLHRGLGGVIGRRRPGGAEDHHGQQAVSIAFEDHHAHDIASGTRAVCHTTGSASWAS